MYSARVLFEIQIEDSLSSQYDEQLLLIAAETREDAFIKARIKGKEESETFVNSKGKKVIWQFIGITELNEIQLTNDIASIDSRTHSPDHGLSFRRSMLEKSVDISEKYPYLLKSDIFEN